MIRECTFCLVQQVMSPGLRCGFRIIALARKAQILLDRPRGRGFDSGSGRECDYDLRVCCNSRTPLCATIHKEFAVLPARFKHRKIHNSTDPARLRGSVEVKIIVQES
jgi:hypothetical protein